MADEGSDFEDIDYKYALLRSDPERFLEICNRHIEQNPMDSDGYYDRHNAWAKLGQFDLALADLATSLALKPDFTTYRSRGYLLRKLGRYREAIADFDTAEAMEPEEWPDGFHLGFRADCHARLGNEAAAMADCARIPDDHWTPAVLGMPGGNKQQLTAELRRIAREVARGPRRNDR